MSRVLSAFRSFFSILFYGVFPQDVAAEFGFTKEEAKPVAPTVQVPTASDGALQILQILQRDSRLIDFLMEDISGYDDVQIGAAVRTLHDECRTSLTRHVSLSPVMDSVEGTFQKMDASQPPDPSRIKLIGNIPASGKVAGGTLRHRGWIASSVNLPMLTKQSLSVLAPAEVEVD